MAVRGDIGTRRQPLAERLSRRLGNGHAAAALALVKERAPDERLALAFLTKLAEDTPDALTRALDNAGLSADLVFCLGASELVAGDLFVMPQAALEFFENARHETAASLRSGLQCAALESDDRAAAIRTLVAFKRRNFLKIAIADLLGLISVIETMELMSALADECIGAAYAYAARITGIGALGAARFCVIAMGKLGAQELNLSSDIDLVYLWESSGDATQVKGATQLGEILTELLSGETFRVDLRLRPGGRNSPLVISIDGALNFYQSLGETWERAALLRARPVGGAIEMGTRALAELGRFIYRRYLDFDTLKQLRAMKRQIEDELRSAEMVERNIKLGRGGIRELEFIVQSLTLVYGGRDPRLHQSNTLTALERLSTLGYVSAERASRLAEAYLFLRNVEHKLQVAAGLQTHSLPAEAAGNAVLAARLGFGKDQDAAARLAAALMRHRTLVAVQFREMLAGGEERKSVSASAGAQNAWQVATDAERAPAALAALGFARPAESANHLALLAKGPAHAPASPRRRELLESLGPALLEEIVRLADPDLALMNLASFIAAVGARTSFLALLEEHPATRRVLLRLFASSSYLSGLFIRHPDMLDALVRSDVARTTRSDSELKHELAELVSACADFEARLDAIRTFSHQEFLRVAVGDLAGDLTLEAVQAELTVLAETVLREALGEAREETARRYPVPETLALCAIAMGRLGAGEMSYNSDLDLIFVYHDMREVAGASREAAARIVQKLIAILEARTREGYAYKIDVRLRPSGNAGPLVASLDGFRDYHRQSSAVWERQALVRARVIAGDGALGEAVEQARAEFVFGRGLKAAEVAEIAAMRTRMEREIAPEDKHHLNIKHGPGGLVDVDFLTQMMALRYGHQYAGLRRRDTVGLIRALGQYALIGEGDGAALEADYDFLSRLENRLRIEGEQPVWDLSTAPLKIAALARRMGYEESGGAERLIEELRARRKRIRALFERVFEAEQRGA